MGWQLLIYCIPLFYLKPGKVKYSHDHIKVFMQKIRFLHILSLQYNFSLKSNYIQNLIGELYTIQFWWYFVLQYIQLFSPNVHKQFDSIIKWFDFYSNCFELSYCNPGLHGGRVTIEGKMLQYWSQCIAPPRPLLWPKRTASWQKKKKCFELISQTYAHLPLKQ